MTMQYAILKNKTVVPCTRGEYMQWIKKGTEQTIVDVTLVGREAVTTNFLGFSEFGDTWFITVYMDSVGRVQIHATTYAQALEAHQFAVNRLRGIQEQQS